MPLKEPFVNTVKSYPAVLTPPRKGSPELGAEGG